MTDEQNLSVEQPEEGSAERPEGLPEKFADVAALAKSYQELEASHTQTRQQLKQQQEEWEAYLLQQDQLQEQAQQEKQLPQYQNELYQRYEEDPLAVQAWLAEQAARRVTSEMIGSQQQSQYALVADAAERQLQAKFNDWEEYAPRISEHLAQHRDRYPEAVFSTPQSTSSVLEEIYKTIKYDDYASGAVQAQQAEAEQRQAKQQAQTVSGAAGRPDAPSDDEEFFARLKAAHNTSYSAFRGGA